MALVGFARRGLPWLATAVLLSCSNGDGTTTSSSSSGSGSGGSMPDAGMACPDPGAAAPVDVFCIGLYENHDVNQRAKSAVHYSPGIAFWSDGAVKDRYLSLPAGTKIDTSDMDAWKFPVGTKAFKEFHVGGVLVETRMLWKQAEGHWVEAAYIWATDLKSAILTEIDAPTLLPSGYEIPSLKSCRKCHGGGSDELLGIEAIATALSTAQGITLASLVADGSLSAPPATTSVMLPEDTTGKAAEALGYLHMNCGAACHSDRGISGFTQLHMRLRAGEFWPGPPSVDTTDTYTTGLNADVILATYQQAFPNTKLIMPGAHDQSLAWLTAHLRGEHQMPPIVSHQIDDTGTQKLADWIDALPH